jgi:hypothetical protein
LPFPSTHLIPFPTRDIKAANCLHLSEGKREEEATTAFKTVLQNHSEVYMQISAQADPSWLSSKKGFVREVW